MEKESNSSIFQYKYIPDSYDYESEIIKGMSYDMFLNIQIKYRESLENILKKYVDFIKLDDNINNLTFPVPILNDLDYNFYHKYSTLESKYIFLRNNIHVERLDKTDISMINGYIIDKELLPENYILSTLDKVIFENGNETFFGTPIDSNKVSSQSLVFEFAYNDRECTVEEGKIIREIYNKIFAILKSNLENNMNIKISTIVNEGFDNSLKQNNNLVR